MTSVRPTAIRHRVIAVSMAMALILYLDRICLAEIVKSDSFHANLALTKEQIGRVLSGFFLSYALFQVPAGWITDRFGARATLTSYIIIWSVATALTGTAASLAGLVAMRWLCGAGEAGAYPASGAVLRRWAPAAARGRASSLVIIGGRCGGMLAPVVTAWMVVRLGQWRPVLWIDGALGLVIAVLYWRTVRDRPEEHPQCNAAERALIGPRLPEPRISVREWKEVWGALRRSRSFWLIALVLFCMNFGSAFLITWLPTFLKEQNHVADVVGGAMVSIVLGCGVLGPLAGGWLTDRSARHFGLRKGRVVALSASALLAGAAYVGCLFMHSAWGLVGCCAVVSFGVDMGNPPTWAFLQDIGGRMPAVVFGWGNMWGNFGAALVSAAVPWLVINGETGVASHRYVFIACATALFLAAGLVFGLDASRPVGSRSSETILPAENPEAAGASA